MPIDRYLRQIRKYTPMTKAEEQEVFKKAKNGDRDAYNLILNSNLRFVVSVAKKYQNQGLDLEELIAEGNLGLVKAYDKFDPSKNYKFITYAVWWIRQAILNAIHENSKPIRIPLNKISNVSKASKLKDVLEQEFSRPMSYEEMSEYIDDPEILDDMKFSYTTIDLDRPLTDNNKDLNNVITDSTYRIDENIEVVKDELDDILKDFTPREREIIYMYYGIGYIRAFTLKEIGYDMGLTRERIRQIKEKVLNKLRRKKRADRLRAYIR